MANNLTQHYRLQNLLHTFLLLAGMLLLLSLIGWLIAGLIGVLWALGCGVVLLITAPPLSSRLVLFLYGARPVGANQLGQLSDIVYWLANRGHLSHRPRLYYIPSGAMLSFSVGLRKEPAIAVSDGLLRALNTREMTGVLAHEVSHIQSRDLWVLAVADVMSRITSLMALTGFIMVLFYLPMFIFKQTEIPWLLLLLLMVAPSLSALMQLALSRTREFSADMQAVNLTGDPEGLISALGKIEFYEKNWFQRLLSPGSRVPDPSLLRTHPLTGERIRRLKEMAQHDHHPFTQGEPIHSIHHKVLRGKPRRRFTGLWH